MQLSEGRGKIVSKTRMGPLRNSDGSAEWEAGQPPHKLRLICSVNGPLEVKTRDELPQDASLELVYRRNTGVPMIRERFIQDKLHTCLLAQLRRDLMPRSLIQVVLQLLEGEIALEAEVSEGINVMTMALMDAGIPMSGIVSAVSYGVTKQDEIVPLLGNTNYKIEDFESLHAVAYKNEQIQTSKIVMCESTGQFSKEIFKNMLIRAQKDTSDVAHIMRKTTEIGHTRT